MIDNRTGARRGRLAAAWVILMLAAAPATGAETLRGTVLDTAGKPAGGAIVWAAELFAPGPLAARETQTDDSGRFTLGLKPGRWYVWARYDGWTGEINQNAIPTIVAGRDRAPLPRGERRRPRS